MERLEPEASRWSRAKPLDRKLASGGIFDRSRRRPAVEWEPAPEQGVDLTPVPFGDRPAIVCLDDRRSDGGVGRTIEVGQRGKRRWDAGAPLRALRRPRVDGHARCGGET